MTPSPAWIYKRLHDGINYRLRTFAAGRFASHCRPTSIVLMTTELCNARCVHCDIWKNKGKEDSPTPQEWKTVLSDLRKWLGPVHVALSGGEALLRPYTVDLVAHGSRLGLFIELLTHGYWDDQARIEQLALAGPWRVTVSLDAVGPTHSRIRGREDFFDKTRQTIATLRRVRKERNLRFMIRLKTVVMRQNLDEICDVARFASDEDGLHVFYQPIEQNYNTVEDSRWFEHSDNWPQDTDRAVAAVRTLIELKKSGAHIDNSYAQLEAMIPYFRDPDSMRLATQEHMAHERRPLCGALTTMQVQANGDLRACAAKPPVGNVKRTPVRQIWEGRPHWWSEGCCVLARSTEAELAARPPVVLRQ